MTTPDRTPAYATKDRVQTILNGLKLVGVIDAIREPDATHVTHQYHITTDAGTGIWLVESGLQRAAPREGIG